MIGGYNTLESEPSPRDDLAIGLRPFLFMGSGGSRWEVVAAFEITQVIIHMHD